MCNFAIISICLCTRGNGGGGAGALQEFFLFFLNWVKLYPLSAEVKFFQQTKPCALDECSRKLRVHVKRVLPAAITAEPWRNGPTKFIKPFNTRSKKGGLGDSFLSQQLTVAALTCTDGQWLSRAHPVITDHSNKTIKRSGDDRNLSGGSFGCFMALGWSCGIATC